MTKVKHYGVNHNDAWLMCSDDPTEGSYVKYEDYETLSNAVIALLTHIRSRYPGQDFTCPHIQLLALLVGDVEKEVEENFKRVQYQGESFDVPDFVKYIATDSNGDRYGYSHKPEVPDWIHAWRTSVSTSDYYFLGVGSSKDWRYSLTEV